MLPSPVFIALFGGVSITVRDEQVDIAAPRARAMIARLALSAGDRVPADGLAHDLWDEPPPSAAVTLRSLASRLRSGPLGPWLPSGRGGYVLDVPGEAVDVVRFRSALRRARHGGPGEHAALREAVAAWAGQPLADLSDPPFARREAEALNAEHREMLERFARARIQDGDADDALDQLSELVRADPLAERPVVLFATALARAGRESEALREIDELSRRLRREAGLDASSSVRDLRTAILRQQVGAPRDAVERHGVPRPITAFHGRDAELLGVDHARARSRLVTLVGPGGVGKTRLAIEAARRTRRQTDSRQYFLDLVPIPDDAGLVAALADLVGALRPEPSAISLALDASPTLLILDNAEHLREHVARLAGVLLGEAPGLSIMVTSREPLRTPGEVRVRVEPLLGDRTREAVELFLARAGDAVGGEPLETASTTEVRRIVAALDGIPLALELAAARLSSRPLADLLHDIRQRGLLGRATGRDRHASVADMIAWSVGLLSHAERDVLLQLGGFAGVFSLDAAAAICEVPGEDVRELVVELADRSLLAVSADDDGGVGYRLLESVRHFVRAAAAPDPAWSRRHRLWHGGLVDGLGPQLFSDAEVLATRVLERSAADMRVALESASSAGDRESALRIVGGLARMWHRRSSLADGRARMEAALAIPGTAPDDVEARAQLGVALIAFFQADAMRALGALAAAEHAARSAGDQSLLAKALAFRAYALGAVGQGEAALAPMSEALALADDAEPAVACTVAMLHADLLRASGAAGRALDGLVRARDAALRAGENWVATMSAHLIAKVLISAHRGQEAIDLVIPTILEAERAGRPTHALAGAMLVAYALGGSERHDEGMRLLAAVDALAARYAWDPDASDPAGNALARSRLRAALTDSERRAARRAGARLSLGQLVEACAAQATPAGRSVLAG